MRIKGVICDLDGTLIDSEDIHTEAWDETIRRNGHVPVPHWHDEFIGKPDEDAANKIRAMFPDVALGVGELVEQKYVIYREMCVAKGGALGFPDIIDKLEALRDAGIGLAVATNSVLANTRVTLKAAGLDHLFAHLATFDSVANGKPAPDIPLAACEKLGLRPEECIVLEDSPTGLKAARAAGCMIGALTTTLPENELHPRDHLFTDPRTALAWIMEQLGM